MNVRIAKRSELADVQGRADDRNLALNRVGVSDLRYPIRVLDRANREQMTVGTFSLTVGLPQEYRGAHLSRFVETLVAHHTSIGVSEMADMLAAVRESHQSADAHVDVTFPYFIKRAAPVSGATAMMEYPCGFPVTLGSVLDFALIAGAAVTTVCPCSKEISDRGAHNQRAQVTVRCRFREFVWLEEIIEMIEASASAPVYPLLKREDEKHVTEQAYDNPRFVEDVVREVALRLNADSRITAWKVEATSFESIHNHNALAVVERDWV